MRPKHYFDEPIHKMYFNLDEIATMLHETRSCVRWWIDCFKIKVTYKRKFVMFSRKMVARLHHIQQMIRVQGFTHRKVKNRLRMMIKYNLA